MGRFYKSFAKFLQIIFYLTRIKDISVFSVYLLHDDSIELLICKKKKNLICMNPPGFAFLWHQHETTTFFLRIRWNKYIELCAKHPVEIWMYMYIDVAKHVSWFHIHQVTSDSIHICIYRKCQWQTSWLKKKCCLLFLLLPVFFPQHRGISWKISDDHLEKS